MHLTLHADYALRVLMYLAARSDTPSSTQEMADAYRISKHHLVRVVQTLGQQVLQRVLVQRGQERVAGLRQHALEAAGRRDGTGVALPV
ncbi:MAG: hypothetical protein EOO72_06945, partial [Myxococcaceae bacterium]